MAAEARRSIPEVSAADVASRLDASDNNEPDELPSPLILDVREPNERAKEGYIPTSLAIPRGVLERDIGKKVFKPPVTEQDLDHPIVLYCGGGSRSLLAAKSLFEMGFTNVSSMAGGFEAWESEQFQIEKG